MSQQHRRIILKPAGLSSRDWTRLGELLAKAVETQQELAAKSPYVLDLTGGLQQDEHGYFVEHEEAEPLAGEPPFDPNTPGLKDKQLVRVAVALFDSLTVAHSAEGRQAKVHGGLCPGVVLVTPDGTEKISDFGFAPAICAALGVQHYLNLALQPLAGEDTERQATGAWEVLSPDEFERQDRICAFR